MTCEIVITETFEPAAGDAVEVEIHYSYTPGAAPIIHPADNADPGWPAEVDLISVAPDTPEILAWARAWLADNYAGACREAEEQAQPDPDAWYDARHEREDRRFADMGDEF